MKEFFIARKFTTKSLELIARCEAIIVAYQADGFDLTLRQLYYQCVVANLFPNSQKSYNNLGSLISDARLAGLIDWDAIKDRGRSTRINPHWDSPADIVESAAASFRVDRWENQSCFVCVQVEKQALEGILVPLCRELDVPFAANKGYCSSSTFYETGMRMRHHAENGKELHIVYLGDADPSGFDMRRDVAERTTMFVRGDVNVHTVALNMDQVQSMNIPSNPAKQTDARFKKFQEQYGDDSYELDGVEPRALVQIVREKVESFIDQDAWDESGKQEENYRVDLKKMAIKYRERQNGAPDPEVELQKANEKLAHDAELFAKYDADIEKMKAKLAALKKK
jgi:hypothetical protein